MSADCMLGTVPQRPLTAPQGHTGLHGGGCRGRDRSCLQSWEQEGGCGQGPRDKAWGGHSHRRVGKGAENPSHLLSTYCILGAFQTDFTLTAVL